MAEPLLLLIEDNPDDAELAARALARSRMKVKLHVVQSAVEALSLLDDPEKPTPKAIFLDLNLPVWNGFEFLRKLRSSPRNPDLPVIVLTTSKEPSDIAQSYKLGANSYITKPVDFTEFIETFSTMSGYWLRMNETV